MRELGSVGIPTSGGLLKCSFEVGKVLGLGWKVDRLVQSVLVSRCIPCIHEMPGSEGGIEISVLIGQRIGLGSGEVVGTSISLSLAMYLRIARVWATGVEHRRGRLE
ncbi:hypothetical protein PENTCL1PPCAC_8079 [Pristionchus entomophagus]|uniref:Ribosomal protein n=1 Tax=Pristionchus entomophagus TaxID=358040 RepID=A0AAV5SX15_9BILA|nr:hypothetical protein PENTCL1PPCAC_8079 [Pristionchus entomophagus]